MNISEQIELQLKSLLKEGEAIKRECGWEGSRWDRWPPADDYLRIRTQALNIVKIACGEGSEHFRELRRLAEGEGAFSAAPSHKSSTASFFLIHVLGIIEAAYRDFGAGLLFDTESRVRADVLSDFIEQADFLCGQKCYAPAGSLAGAVLEDTLRTMCDRHALSYPAQTNIEALNSSLYAAKVYDRLVMKQITAYADLLCRSKE